MEGEDLFTRALAGKEREKVVKKPPEPVKASNVRELNPYLRDGGRGLPKEDSDRRRDDRAPRVGDGGASWRAKALKRAQERAADEGRSVDEIVEDRWGKSSTELAAERHRSNDSERAYLFGSQRMQAPSDDRGSRHRDRDRDRSRHRDRDYDPSRNRDRDRDHDRSRDRERDRGHDRDSGRDRRDRDRDRDRDRGTSMEDRDKSRGSHRDDKESQRQGSTVPKLPPGVPSDGSFMDWFKKANEAKAAPEPAREANEPALNRGPVAEAAPVPTAAPPAAASNAPVDLNKLTAQAMRAKLMGNTKLHQELMAQVEEAKKGPAVIGPSTAAADGGKEVRVLDVVDENGRPLSLVEKHVREVGSHAEGPPSKRLKKDKQIARGKDMSVEKYYNDDNKFDLQQLVARQKLNIADDDYDKNYADNIMRNKSYKAEDLSDEESNLTKFEARRKRMDSEKQKARDRQGAINAQRKHDQILNSCMFCFANEKRAKHLTIAMGLTTYLALPFKGRMSAGHCIITTMEHEVSSVTIDESTWTEIRNFKKCLVMMFHKLNKDVIFMETVGQSSKKRHFFIDCIPLSRDIAGEAPIYFKKAIMEADEEWSQHKKVIDTRGMDIRRCVPKNFPYFHVEFGMGGGFAHVIENEDKFPHTFGRSIVGGIADIEPGVYLRPKKETFEVERQMVLDFLKTWKDFDWTLQLED